MRKINYRVFKNFFKINSKQIIVIIINKNINGLCMVENNNYKNS